MSRRPASRIPRDRAGRFVNWARTEASAPTVWHLPASEAEVVELVTRSRAAGRRLRVVGAGHSFSPINRPDGDAVSLDAFSGPPQLDRDDAHVTVPAGMRLRDLSAWLLRSGLALPIVGSIQAQTVAGAIATGTHGSSLTHGNLAGLVTAMRVVTGTGEVLALDNRDDRLAGARVHLGAVGVVTQVTLPVRAATARSSSRSGGCRTRRRPR
jgi:FAD/FMN-containing dehydrogenase